MLPVGRPWDSNVRLFKSQNCQIQVCGTICVPLLCVPQTTCHVNLWGSTHLSKRIFIAHQMHRSAPEETQTRPRPRPIASILRHSGRLAWSPACIFSANCIHVRVKSLAPARQARPDLVLAEHALTCLSMCASKYVSQFLLCIYPPEREARGCSDPRPRQRKTERGRDKNNQQQSQIDSVRKTHIHELVL